MPYSQIAEPLSFCCFEEFLAVVLVGVDERRVDGLVVEHLALEAHAPEAVGGGEDHVGPHVVGRFPDPRALEASPRIVAARVGDHHALRARVEREGVESAPLSVGLIDIDNFKKLNDSLGHAAGDEALKALAAAVRDRLRPIDHVARFGGEEFVVLLPDTAVDEAQQALTRLQRSLTEALFLHEGREIFVTFSAGVSVWRPGEALEAALERADVALYEAKRTGKNRTCVG